MFVRIIRDAASPPEEESIRLSYESLKIAFPNNLPVSKFHSSSKWSHENSSSLHGNKRSGGGGAEPSSLAFKGTCTKTGC